MLTNVQPEQNQHSRALNLVAGLANIKIILFESELIYLHKTINKHTYSSRLKNISNTIDFRR